MSDVYDKMAAACPQFLMRHQPSDKKRIEELAQLFRRMADNGLTALEPAAEEDKKENGDDD